MDTPILDLLATLGVKEQDLFQGMELGMLREVGEYCRWVQRDMAMVLGVTPRALNYKLRLYGLRPMDGGPTHAIRAGNGNGNKGGSAAPLGDTGGGEGDNGPGGGEVG